MSKYEKEGFMRRLLSWREGMTLRNIKFCRGDRDVISEEEFRAAVGSVIEQSSSVARSTTPVHSEIRTIDVREFVAKL